MTRAILLAIIPLLIVGCLDKDNPLGFDPNTPLGTGAGNLPYVVSVDPANATRLEDDDPHAGGIQATAVVTFSDFMDENGLLESIRVLNTTTGVDVANLELDYVADARKLFVRHLDWSANCAFLLFLETGGVRNRWGAAIDGNGNGNDDGAPYDDALSTFYTEGSSSAACVPVAPPRLISIAPDTLRVGSSRPTLTIDFDAPLDTNTLTTANFTLTSSGGSSVQLSRASVTPVTVSFEPTADLTYGRIYTITVHSSGIRAEEVPNAPEYLLVLDADRDGAEAEEPDYESYFLCDTVPAPTVRASSIEGGIRFDFSQQMDESTLTPENVRAFDDQGYIPGTMHITNHGPGDVCRIDYYFARPTAGADQAFVAKEAESLDGRMLDGQESPNGIGGEPWDDFWWD